MPRIHKSGTCLGLSILMYFIVAQKLIWLSFAIIFFLDWLVGTQKFVDLVPIINSVLLLLF